MTDADDTIPPAKTPPRRKRWLLPVALVLVGIIGLVFWISRIQARRLIIGETDSATGLKYSFTVGQGWKNNPTYKYQPGFAFKVPDRGAFQVWMENNILPRKISRPGFAVETGLRVGSKPDSMMGGFGLQDGYPTVLFPKKISPRIPFTILEQKHLLISGQPAVWLVLRQDFSLIGAPPGFITKTPPYYLYSFVIKVHNQPLWYHISGETDEDHRDQIRREVEAVGESFRIEQVRGAVGP